MQTASSSNLSSPGGFKTEFNRLVAGAMIGHVPRPKGPKPGRPPKLTVRELLVGLVFHCLQGRGTLAQNTGILLRKHLADSSLSDRRQSLPWQVFTTLMKAALRPKATPKKNPQAFYKKWRLVAIDGTQFSVSNTPQILEALRKAASRRLKAAFAKVGMVMLVELGIHNPLAAVIGKEGESELVLAKELLGSLPEQSLLIADRLYGIAAFLVLLTDYFSRAPGRAFLVRVRSNLQPTVVERCGDGSALVEAKVSKGGEKIFVREIRGRVRRPDQRWVEVRFWSSLLDWKQYPAKELLALYAQRWEQELMYQELKIDMRQSEVLRSHTVETAAQEIAALIVAHAILAEQRLGVAKQAVGDVLRISFGKTLVYVRALWFVLAAGEGVLSSDQTTAMTRKVMKLIAEMSLPPRRKRSCPRAVRQPIGSWPRLTKNTYSSGATEYKVATIAA